MLFRGDDASRSRGRSDELRYRSQVQIIFQDPFDSLNPVKTVRHHIERPLRIHKVVPSNQIEARVYELLARVGLNPPAEIAAKYPHELSGGQRQRVAIARVLGVEPKVILADEPTSMLDVSIRIGILNLMRLLAEERGIAFLYVTHDLAAARYVADDILVMYAGQIVEQGPVEEVLAAPLHPYTRLLLAAAPDPANPLASTHIERSSGRASAAIAPAAGCRFLPRCPLAVAVCSEITPQLAAPEPGHAARCHVTAPSPDREDRHARRPDHLPRRLHLGRGHRLVPDRGRRAGGRPRRERAGTGSRRRRARCETATPARSRATSTTGIPTTSR